MNLLETLEDRSCPVCNASTAGARPFIESTVDASLVNDFSFASRKVPEFMSFKLVECLTCETVYAAAAPPAAALAKAYHEANYDSREEAKLAADAYIEAMMTSLSTLRKGRAMEIGAGTGVLLQRLKDVGFVETIGVEPSCAAIAAADPEIRDSLREGVFVEADFKPESFDLICCFQTLEHVPDPRELTASCKRLLRPNGLLAFVTHDYQAPINRLLGRRSPIIDIEHMQLFCRKSLTTLLENGGLKVVELTSFRNTYPLSYWLRLAPLPRLMKGALRAAGDRTRLSRLKVSVDVGNLLTIGRKAQI